jgi:tight adherence protein B
MDAGPDGGAVNYLLPLAALFPMLAVAGVFVLLRMQRQEQALKQRIASLHDKGPRLTPATSASLIRRDTTKPTLAARLGALIAYDPVFRAQYGLPWFVVLGGATLAGRAAVLGASGVVGIWAWVLLPVVAIGGSRTYYSGANTSRREKLLAQFPDALALIVRAVRVGIPVPESLRAVAREAREPTRSEFDLLQGQIAMGRPLDGALRELAVRNSIPEYGFFAAVITLQAQTGGALSETLETLADIIRRRIAMKERGHALSSEARTSTYVLGALPIVAGALMYFTSPSYIGLLFTEPTGHMLLGAAALSLATGMGAMRFIIRKTLS